jgi:hypothetical protein
MTENKNESTIATAANMQVENQKKREGVKTISAENPVPEPFIDTTRLIACQKRSLFWRNTVKESPNLPSDLLHEFNETLSRYNTILSNWSNQKSLNEEESFELYSLERRLNDLENQVRLLGRFPSYSK